MSQELEDYLDLGKANMDDTIAHLTKELTKIRAGKASASMLDGLKVDYYGTPTPISQVANLSTPDSKTISIQPWEKPCLIQLNKQSSKLTLA